MVATVGEQGAAMAIARKVVDGKGDKDDVAVLLDWIREREEHRRHDARLGAQTRAWDREQWWVGAFAKDPQAAAFAITLGCEDMSGKELIAALQRVEDYGTKKERRLAERFAELNHAWLLIKSRKARQRPPVLTNHPPSPFRE